MTNASRTQLMSLVDLAWDAEALDIFGIPTAILPQIRPSSFRFGETIPVGSLPGGIPIASLIGDSHASLYGLGGFRPGSVKATYGTGSSLMTPTSQPIFSRHGLSTTVAWASEERSFDFAQQTTPGFAQDAHWQNMGTEVRVDLRAGGQHLCHRRGYAVGGRIAEVG